MKVRLLIHGWFARDVAAAVQVVKNNTNMAPVSLFWETNMVHLTSWETTMDPLSRGD